MDTKELIKIYIPNITNDVQIGGGWTFLRNLRKGLQGKVEFVDKWQDSDIVFCFSITTMDKAEVHEAVKAGKKLVLRVDNIPRKSRNKRQSPAERLTEFGNIASVVVYQSQWCKEYAGYFIKNDNEVIINNGVDTSIFNQNGRASDGNTYLYINYNDNPNKRFDEALYWFDMEWRKNNDAHLIIAGNAPRLYLEHPEYNWDLPTPGQVRFWDVTQTPEETAELMKTCDFLLYPSFAEAYPNTLLEAMACGVKPLYLCEEGGAIEAFCNNCGTPDGLILDREIINYKKVEDYKMKTIQEMGNKYLKLFNSLNEVS